MELSHHMKCYALDVWARGSFAGFHEIDESDFGDLFLNQTQKEPGRVTAVTAKEEKTGFQAQWALQGNSESIEGLKMDLGESGEALNVSMILHQKSREKWKVSHPMALSFFFFNSEKTHPSKVNNWDIQGGLQVTLQALNAGGLGLIPVKELDAACLN